MAGEPANRRLAVCVGVVTAAGVAVLAAVAVAGVGDLGPTDVLAVLAALILLGELFPIRVPGHDGELAVTTPFGLAVLVICGMPAVVLVQAATTLLADVLRRRPARKIAYNVGQLSISWAVAGLVWEALRASGEPLLSSANLPPGLAAGAVFFACNHALAGLPVALEEGRPVIAALRTDLGFEATTSLVLVLLAPVVIALALERLELLPLLVLPLGAIHRGARQAAINEHQAAHDALTGLPNRGRFRRRVEEAIRLAAKEGGTVAVLLMDLDRFKEVNDTLGHDHGDDLLVAVSRRLAGTLDGRGTIARLGGDEFGLVVGGLQGPADAGAVATRVLASCEEPIEVGGLALRVDASVGIAAYPVHGGTADLLIQRADVALYVAKDLQRGFEFYADEHDDHSPAKLALASELRGAISEGDLVVWYQPVIRLSDMSLAGVEALMRWRHPRRGDLEPGAFVPLAERTGLIRPLTMHALSESLRQAQAWRAEGAWVKVAVNLSPRNLLDGGLTAQIRELLQQYDVDPSQLELELTESSIMADPGRSEAVMRELRAMGLELAIDDFGTGYSSLAYLKKLPVSRLKIDRSFVRAMQGDSSDEVIVRATIELARNLGLRVTAEGVETEWAREALAALGCECAQGYLFSRPVPPAALGHWLARAPAAPHVA
jgi:diguanylate cyclase (GGDEF)-like protein